MTNRVVFVWIFGRGEVKEAIVKMNMDNEDAILVSSWL